MLMLSMLNGFESTAVNFFRERAQALIDKHAYLHVLQGFQTDPNLSLKLKKNPHDINQEG